MITATRMTLRLLGMSVIALTFSCLAATAHAGSPPVTAIRALCSAQQGSFFGVSQTGQYVVCDSPAVPFTDQQVGAARHLCINAYRGLFTISGPTGRPSWYCVYQVF